VVVQKRCGNTAKLALDVKRVNGPDLVHLDRFCGRVLWCRFVTVHHLKVTTLWPCRAEPEDAQ